MNKLFECPVCGNMCKKEYFCKVCFETAAKEKKEARIKEKEARQLIVNERATAKAIAREDKARARQAGKILLTPGERERLRITANAEKRQKYRDSRSEEYAAKVALRNKKVEEIKKAAIAKLVVKRNRTVLTPGEREQIRRVAKANKNKE